MFSGRTVSGTLFFFLGLLPWSSVHSAAASAAAQSYELLLSDTGDFALLLDGQQWFSSSSVFFRANGKVFSTRDGSLRYMGDSVARGEDEVLGRYEKHSLHFLSSCEEFSFFGNIYEYETSLVFEQVYPVSLVNTSSGDADAVISSFPSFDLHEEKNRQDIGYAQWVSWFYTDQEGNKGSGRRRALVAPGFDSPLVGRWNDKSVNVSDGMGGSGVVCIFEPDGEHNRAVVLAPLDNFMSSSHQFFPEDGTVSYGIMGNVTDIPVNFSMKTMLFVGSGINGVMSEWGSQMRAYYGKADSRKAYEKDVTLQYLGFTTDNGAFYYYNTVPNMNYQETMEAVTAYATADSIPYKYALLDSWFYYRGSNDGVKEWDAMPDVFPDGLEGLFKSTGLLVQAHNRYWAPDAVYASQNGGSYEFIIDRVNDGAAPADDTFWNDLFANSASSWGLRVYEQDWLFNEVMYVGEMLESTSRARTWLLQMGEGAKKNNLTIQYCMPYIRHLLQSLEVGSVTQARASDDYKPSEDSGQWRIGGQNIFISALGLAPSKDGVYSSSVQNGNPYDVADGDVLEPYPRLQAAVATLSAGPVAFADGIHNSDRNLIMRSCMKDGRLLVPSFPAKTIDQAIKSAALGTAGVEGEVWLAKTSIDSQSVYYLFAAEVVEESAIYPSDLSLDQTLEYFVFESSDTSVIKLFSTTQPLRLKETTKGEFSLWTISPIERNGMGLQGEVDKWVGVSEARFISIAATAADEMTVEVYGVANERISVGFVNSSQDQIIVSCSFDDSKLETRQVPSPLSERGSVAYLVMHITSSGSCV